MAKKPSLSPSGIALRVKQAESAIQFSLEAAPPAQRAAVAEHMGALREDLLRLINPAPPPPQAQSHPGESRPLKPGETLRAPTPPKRGGRGRPPLTAHKARR